MRPHQETQTRRCHSLRRWPGARHGFTLVWCSLLMVVMLGITGLVIDSGLLWAAHRQTQNAADAAALAVAVDLLRNVQSPDHTTRATTFVQTHNGLTNATVTVNTPPATGPYEGASSFAEVIVSYPVQTAFIQILGVNQERSVTARAVAGFEPVTSGEGVAVLDPDARPGISVQGDGTVLRVLGHITVNSEGGGLDEFGQPVNNGNGGYAATYGGGNSLTSGILATAIDVVGGVDDPNNFKDVDTGLPGNVLACRQPPGFDPLLSLTTPTTANGVDATFRGSPKITSGSATLDDPSGLNTFDSATGITTLNPGIYSSIEISGGTIVFQPGIYVLKPDSNGNGDTMSITGNPSVTGNGVMFYNTGSNYDPNTGAPDIGDGEIKPPANGPPADLANFGGFSLNANSTLSPIDTTKYSYSNPKISVFNGILFYQRRQNRTPIDLSASGGSLTGTLYAKWGAFKVAGQGTFGAQFIAGSLQLAGGGTIVLSFSGVNLGRSNQVFLVE